MFYKSNGRLDKITSGGNTTHYNYNARGQLETVGSQNGTANGDLLYGYDNYGNRTLKDKRIGANTYETVCYGYTRGNLLESVQEFNGNGVKDIYYSYNYQGVRYKKEVGYGPNKVTTYYYFDGDKLLGEDKVFYNGQTDKLRYFYDIDGLSSLMYKNGNSDWQYYSYVRDALQNIVAIVHDYDVRARYTYDCFGNCTVKNTNGTTNITASFIGNINPFRWKSHYYDADTDIFRNGTGLYYIDGHFYDPETSLFLNAADMSVVVENALSPVGLDRNGLGCVNAIEFFVAPYNIATIIPLVSSPFYVPPTSAQEQKKQSVWWKPSTWDVNWKLIGSLALMTAGLVIALFSPVGKSVGIGLMMIDGVRASPGHPLM